MGDQNDEPPSLDEIGRWSELKLDIIRKYAQAYSRILARQPRLYHVYIDGFAGAGLHISRATGQVVGGSPANVMRVEPKFRQYHFVEIDPAKANHLRKLFAGKDGVVVHEGDCNEILPSRVFPTVRWGQSKRALCLLDPYGLHLDWGVVEHAGRLRTIDLLLNFPVMDMNMNVLWHTPDAVKPEQASRMTRFWGDDGWRQAAYRSEATLFGDELRKTGNEAVVAAYVERLKKAAGFEFVADPLPMRNSTNAVVYYLLFASPNKTAHKIVQDMFRKLRGAGGP